MTTWIFPAQPPCRGGYDFEHDFKNDGFVLWGKTPQMKSIESGDCIYIYLSSPVKEIRYKCIVEDADVTEEGEKGQRDEDNKYLSLYPLIRYSSNNHLAYHDLKAHGLKSRVESAQRLSEEVTTYIHEVEAVGDLPEEIMGSFDNHKNDYIYRRAQKDSCLSPRRRNAEVVEYVRSPNVARFARHRANGNCQLCGQKAPFIDKNGLPYLEVHHVVWLSQGGSDAIDNVVALCPNCHRKMHIVQDDADIEYLKKLAKQIQI